MADFVENEPKCVMLVIPHHPPRLAQLSGVFVVCNTKSRHSASTNEPLGLVDEPGFIDRCASDI